MAHLAGGVKLDALQMLRGFLQASGDGGVRDFGRRLRGVLDAPDKPCAHPGADRADRHGDGERAGEREVQLEVGKPLKSSTSVRMAKTTKIKNGAIRFAARNGLRE